MARPSSFNTRFAGHGAQPTREHRWLIVLAVMAAFAFYVLSGHFSVVNLTTPQGVTSETNSVATEASSAVVTSDAPLAETSSLLTTEASSVEATSDTPVAETSSLLTTDAGSAVAESSAPAVETSSAVVETTEAESVVVAAAPAETLPVAVAAPASPVVTAGPVERWAAAGIVLVVDGQEWDNRSFANVDAALSQLPSSILARLGNPALGPLHILVNTQGRSLSGQQPYGGAANYFSTNDGRNELVLYPGQSVFTVLHEMGHAFNLRNTPAGQYGRVVSQAEMGSFMTATGWVVTSSPEQVASAVDHMAVSFNYTGTFQWQGLSHFDPLEDFANSFAMYYSDRSGLAAMSPERHGWLAANLPR